MLNYPDVVALMNETTWRSWKQTDQVRNQFNSVRVLDRLADSDAQQLRADQGLPAVVIYKAKAKTVTGTTRKLIPDGQVVYLPRSGPVGATKWALPAIASDPDISLEADLTPGPVAYLTKSTEPYGVYTHGQAVGFPLFADTDSTYALDTEP